MAQNSAVQKGGGEGGSHPGDGNLAGVKFIAYQHLFWFVPRKNLGEGTPN